MRPVALLVVALLLAGCASSPDAPAADTRWSFVSTEGETISHDSPARDATVLFFMATWCTSCRAKAPVLAAVQEEYAARGVATYSLDFDPSETEDDLRAWKERYRQDWPHGIDEGLAIQRAFGVTSQSSVVVLDGAGAVVEHFGYGKVTESALREALERALDPSA